ncbi:MAG: TonB-dependent receptor [Cytophagaceae bacterium]|nr:TonB-dependent receptor [Cytophagaceae bacterium]MDW8456877.1 TonB-dependent receptor [Cytophagaceae bacterium]
MNDKITDTKSKALRINLDPRPYGSLAEIGAGQEVAAFFFKAGAASQTIAKTMSAYDMTFSDAIYGKEEHGRYVSESRLHKMLDREYSLLEERLRDVRGERSTFFAFADTVVTINFQKTNQGHGWMGVQFQLHPFAKPNKFILHVRMMEKEATAQQQALGIMGVNMIYACIYYHSNIEVFMDSLMDNLTTERIKIDKISLTGPDFKHIDNRVLALMLVQKGYTNAALFDKSGEVREPADLFYKKHIVALRGRFRPCTKVNIDMFETGVREFEQEEDVEKDKIVQVAELTLNNLRSEGEINYQDFLYRADLLCSLGKNVLISNYQEYYRLVDFFNRYTKLKIGIILGPYNLADIFNEKYYTNLKGGILESFALLFSRNVKLYVYPALKPDGSLYNAETFTLPEHLRYLYMYLFENNKIKDIRGYQHDILHIFSDKVIDMLKKNTPGWEDMVPKEVEIAIKEKNLFGYTADEIQTREHHQNDFAQKTNYPYFHLNFSSFTISKHN